MGSRLAVSNVPASSVFKMITSRVSSWAGVVGFLSSVGAKEVFLQGLPGRSLVEPTQKRDTKVGIPPLASVLFTNLK